MTGDEYILSVLSRYRLSVGPASPAYKVAVQLYPIIRAWANRFLLEVMPSGSYAKGTGIKGSTDIDLFISLKSETTGTLKEIYESLFIWLNQRYLSPRRQNVSIGLSFHDISVDLVPARKQSGNTNDHSLFKNKIEAWTQTNVQTHINMVLRSGRLNEICAVKIWRGLNKLSFPSFYLELTVLDALYRKPTNQLALNVWSVLLYLRDHFVQARVVDPSNSNNVISDDLSFTEKQAIQSVALLSCTKKHWEQILW